MSNILKIAGAGAFAAEETDENFNQTVLLLHGDGTNGAQNNTFLDSSTNNFTITRAGNTTQGTFSPFSAPDGRWSNYFPGASNYLSVANNSAISFGTGDFTFEFWVLMPLVPSGTTWFLFDKRSASNATPWAMAVDLNNGGSVYWYDGTVRRSSISVTPNVWQHYAITRSSGTLKMWVNGVEAYSATVTIDLSGAGNLLMGCRVDLSSSTFLPGYLSNVRAVKGTALYTSAFTPSTSPLTTTSQGATESEVGLLTCQSNRFVDNSTNNLAITVGNTPKVTPFSPFAPTAAYSAATNGGSAYFDGTGDTLSLGQASPGGPLDLSTAIFTAEAWVYVNSLSTIQDVISQAAASISGNSSVDWSLRLNTNGTVSFVTVTGSSVTLVTSTATISTNTWNHVAAVRSGTTGYVCVNGVVVSGTVSSTFNSNRYTTIGGLGASDFNVNGYISNLRILKGTALYTSNFTTPTAPLTNITNTSLLCNFTNAGIYDNTGKNNLETRGNTQIDTTTKKFGTGSIEFDGAGDSLIAGTITDFGFFHQYSPKFTIEFWGYFNLTSPALEEYVMTTQGATATNGFWLWRNRGTANNFYFLIGNGTSSPVLRVTACGSFTPQQWNHFAITYDHSLASNNFNMWVNGVLSTTASKTGAATNNGNQDRPFEIGRYTDANPYNLNAFLDDIRITRDVIRYPAGSNFTPPDKAFPDL